MTVGAGDTMTGGGAGTFVFKAVLSTPATITDFTSGANLIADCCMPHRGWIVR